MKRVAFTIVSTIVGLVLLLQFKVHSTGTSTGGFAAVGPSSVVSSPVRLRHSSGARRHPAATSTKPTKSHKPTKPATQTITGQTVQTQYGPVQVQIVETGQRLTDVTALQLPHANPRSQEIAASAVPVLRSEALQAGSARIHVVSGATYTSNGYAQSLQSALDNA